MAVYSDIVRNELAVPVEGASIYVYDTSGGLADLEGVDGQAISNPVTSDEYGAFQFSAPDGLYALEVWYAGKRRYSDNAVQVGVGLPLPDSVLLALADPNSASLIGFRGGTLEEELTQVFNVKHYGAQGDGVTNDNLAIEAAAQALEDAGGGVLLFPAGTYLCGLQTLVGADGQGASYRINQCVDIRNCTKPVIIRGEGAVLKAAAGLRYGSFHPVTGAIYNPPSMPFTNSNYRANGILFINVQLNKSVEISGLEIDGNIDAYIKGGTWGDVGYQLGSYGISARSNDNLTIRDVHIHHHPLDGLAVGWPGMTANTSKRPHLLTGVRSEYNGRQGFSIIGTNSLVAINCSFSFTGQSASGIASAPGAGLDIEAEGATNRDMLFINCRMESNNGCAMVADSGDSADARFLSCTFIGTTNFTIWPRKPGFKFEDCKIYGAWVNAYASAVAREATQFRNCDFSMDQTKSSTGVLYGMTNYMAQSIGENVLFENCDWDTAGSMTAKLPSSPINTIWRNCRFKQDGPHRTLTNGIFEGVNKITLGPDGYMDIPGATRTGLLTVNGAVLGQYAAVATPAGGTTIDTQARAAISGILTSLRSNGTIQT